MDTLQAITSDTTKEQQIVTKEFLNLVKFIDSSGFISDSARFTKTYNQENQTRPIKIDNYFFYELRLEETVPISEFYPRVKGRTEFENERKPEIDSVEWKRWQEWRNRWELDYSLFEKVEKIVSYFYVEKTLLNGTGDGTYYDGIIEEWKFPDTKSAKDAAEELAKKETKVYVNRGAYVCYLGDYMYVFHSRSAGFYTPLKKFLEYVAEKNKATIPNKAEQRKNY
jgi:hypothetical protein